MSRTADALIVGGGVHGCATALHLAMRGLRPVLFEKDYAGRHASGVNAGGVRQLARDVAEIPLSIRSMGLWETIGDLVDDDCGFEQTGQILVAETEDELDAMRARVADLHARGFTHEELIDAAELRRLAPAVTDSCPGGVVSRRDGFADPARTTAAFRRKAAALGATTLEGARVDDARKEGRDFVVSVAGEEWRAPILVNAAGAWAGAIAARFGEPVPLEPIAPMLMISSRVPPFIKPVVILRGRKLSFKQFANGSVMIGGGHLGRADIATNETLLDWRKLQISARTVWELFPIMRGATIVRAWAGIESRLPDDLPVIGPSARHEGLFHQFGFSAHGFQLGPGAGVAMAEMIVAGATNTPLDGLGVNRFSPEKGPA